MLTSIFIIRRGKVPLHEEWRKREEGRSSRKLGENLGLYCNSRMAKRVFKGSSDLIFHGKLFELLRYKPVSHPPLPSQ